MGLGRRFEDWLKRRHPRIAAWPWHEICGAGLACLVGLAIMLISVLDARDDAFPSGRPVAFLAGLVFFLAGVAIARPALARRQGTTLLQRAVVATLLSAFAAVPVLLALGGGALPLFASVAVLALLALAAWDGVIKRLIPRRAMRLSLYAGLVIVAGAVLQAGPREPAATPPAAPLFEPVALAVESETVTAGGTVHVTFDRPISMPRGYGYWISIVPKEAPVHAQGLWTYLAPGAMAAELPAPDEPGDYEVRLHPHLNAVLSSAALVVHRGEAPRFVERPEPAAAELPAEAR